MSNTYRQERTTQKFWKETKPRNNNWDFQLNWELEETGEPELPTQPWETELQELYALI